MRHIFFPNSVNGFMTTSKVSQGHCTVKILCGESSQGIVREQHRVTKEHPAVHGLELESSFNSFKWLKRVSQVVVNHKIIFLKSIILPAVTPFCREPS